MSIIKVKCTDQVLAFENTPVISSGGVGEDYVSFSFCPLWNGYYKTAVFWRTKDEVYHQVLDATNSAAIPPEVLTSGGVIYFGVFGVNNAKVQRTSNILTYTVEQGAITEGTQPSDPTPDIYTQLLAAVAALGDNKGKADKVESATAGHLAGLDANGNLTDSGKKAEDFVAASEKAKPDGIATLNGDGIVPDSQLPKLVAASEKGAPGGVATLDETGKIPAAQLNDTDFGETILWLVPYSGDGPAVFETPDNDGNSFNQTVCIFDLPKPIDCSQYLYGFTLDVYGIARVGDNGLNTICGEVYLLTEDGDEAEVTPPILSTEKLGDSGVIGNLTFPSLARYAVEQMATGHLHNVINGGYRGESVVNKVTYRRGDVLGMAVYNRVEFKVQTGYVDKLHPVETFGVKLTYRKIGRRES